MRISIEPVCKGFNQTAIVYFPSQIFNSCFYFNISAMDCNRVMSFIYSECLRSVLSNKPTLKYILQPGTEIAPLHYAAPSQPHLAASILRIAATGRLPHAKKTPFDSSAYALLKDIKTSHAGTSWTEIKHLLYDRTLHLTSFLSLFLAGPMGYLGKLDGHRRASQGLSENVSRANNNLLLAEIAGFTGNNKVGTHTHLYFITRFSAMDRALITQLGWFNSTHKGLQMDVSRINKVAVSTEIDGLSGNKQIMTTCHMKLFSAQDRRPTGRHRCLYSTHEGLQADISRINNNAIFIEIVGMTGNNEIVVIPRLGLMTIFSAHNRILRTRVGSLNSTQEMFQTDVKAAFYHRHSEETGSREQQRQPAARPKQWTLFLIANKIKNSHEVEIAVGRKPIRLEQQQQSRPTKMGRRKDRRIQREEQVEPKSDDIRTCITLINAETQINTKKSGAKIPEWLKVTCRQKGKEEGERRNYTQQRENQRVSSGTEGKPKTITVRKEQNKSTVIRTITQMKTPQSLQSEEQDGTGKELQRRTCRRAPSSSQSMLSAEKHKMGNKRRSTATQGGHTNQEKATSQPQIRRVNIRVGTKIRQQSPSILGRNKLGRFARKFLLATVVHGTQHCDVFLRQNACNTPHLPLKHELFYWDSQILREKRTSYPNTRYTSFFTSQDTNLSTPYAGKHIGNSSAPLPLGNSLMPDRLGNTLMSKAPPPKVSKSSASMSSARGNNTNNSTQAATTVVPTPSTTTTQASPMSPSRDYVAAMQSGTYINSTQTTENTHPSQSQIQAYTKQCSRTMIRDTTPSCQCADSPRRGEAEEPMEIDMTGDDDDLDAMEEEINANPRAQQQTATTTSRPLSAAERAAEIAAAVQAFAATNSQSTPTQPVSSSTAQTTAAESNNRGASSLSTSSTSTQSASSTNTQSASSTSTQSSAATSGSARRDTLALLRATARPTTLTTAAPRNAQPVTQPQQPTTLATMREQLAQRLSLLGVENSAKYVREHAISTEIPKIAILVDDVTRRTLSRGQVVSENLVWLQLKLNSLNEVSDPADIYVLFGDLGLILMETVNINASALVATFAVNNRQDADALIAQYDGALGPLTIMEHAPITEENINEFKYYVALGDCELTLAAAQVAIKDAPPVNLVSIEVQGRKACYLIWNDHQSWQRAYDKHKYVDSDTANIKLYSRDAPAHTFLIRYFITPKARLTLERAFVGHRQPDWYDIEMRPVDKRWTQKYMREILTADRFGIKLAPEKIKQLLYSTAGKYRNRTSSAALIVQGEPEVRKLLLTFLHVDALMKPIRFYLREYKPRNE